MISLSAPDVLKYCPPVPEVWMFISLFAVALVITVCPPPVLYIWVAPPDVDTLNWVAVTQLENVAAHVTPNVPIIFAPLVVNFALIKSLVKS